MAANFMSFFEVPKPIEPEVCLIGIGYKIKDMADWFAWRYRDLSLTNVPAVDAALSKMLSESAGRQIEVKTGGAARFLEFMIKEALPFIESNYRVSKNGRGIAGYSLGGGFSLYVLFKQPDLFSLYYAGSPSIGNLFDFEKEYASSH
jgi:predicted alpha/beta superfamily hydrolase